MMSLNKSLQIGNRTVGPGSPVFVIAEIGANFFSRDEAIAMIEAAALVSGEPIAAGKDKL